VNAAANFWTEKPAAGWAEYWDTLHAPHRTAVVQALQQLPAWTSLLEVGCGPGVNLWRILDAFPDADLRGLDLSQTAIDQGAAKFAQADMEGGLKGSGGVALCAGSLPEALAPMDPVDVVLSVYTLAYVPPPDISETLSRLTELAQHAIILAEPMVAPGLTSELLHRHPAETRHDYLRWFNAIDGWHVTTLKPVIVQRLNRLLVAQRKAMPARGIRCRTAGVSPAKDQSWSSADSLADRRRALTHG
jgi:trans-aconitate methyltransferase